MNNLINWFELKARYIATWTPRHAIDGYYNGADACGYRIEAAQWLRALEIQDGWREARRERDRAGIRYLDRK